LQDVGVDTINLYEYALEKARESALKRELPTVAMEAGVDYSWLGKFARGKIPGASYAMVHQLALCYMNREAARQLTPEPGRAAA
jgi:hypothetical protein